MRMCVVNAPWHQMLPATIGSQPRPPVMTFGVIGQAFENESLHLCIWASTKSKGDGKAFPRAAFRGENSRDRMLGEVWLPITKVFSTKSAASDSSLIDFSEVELARIYCSARRGGMITCRERGALWAHGTRIASWLVGQSGALQICSAILCLGVRQQPAKVIPV